MKSNNEFFGLLSVVRDKFAGDIKSAKRLKKQRYEDMRENLKPGSPAYIKEQASLADDYAESVRVARSEALDAIEEGYSKAINAEKSKLRGFCDAAPVLRSLELLKGLPLTVEEFGELVDIYGGKSYWSDKCLKEIADNNGIDPAGMIEPDFGYKMQVLTDIRDHFLRKIENFDIENEDVDLLGVSLSDNMIRLSEGKLTGDYINYQFTPERRARMMLDDAGKLNNPFLIASRVANILKTADIETARAVADIVENSKGFWSNIASYGGVSAGLAAFHDRERTHYQKIADQCAELSLTAEVSKLSPAEKAIAKANSKSNKITRRGLDFLHTPEGARELAEFQRIGLELDTVEDAETAETAALQEHIESVLR